MDNNLLSKLFNDPKTGFVGADKLLRRAKQYNPKITLAQVKDFLAHNSIHKYFKSQRLQMLHHEFMEKLVITKQT